MNPVLRVCVKNSLQDWGLRFFMTRTDISVADQRAQIQKELEQMEGMLDIGLSDHSAAAGTLSYRLRAAFIAGSAAGLWLALFELTRLALGA
jgi:hypothetical protein